MKATDTFFAQAEENVMAIGNCEDFLSYIQQFAKDKDEFFQNTFAEYKDENGNVKVFTEDEWKEIQSFIDDRTTAYNKVESAKVTELLMPIIEKYENAVNGLCENYNTKDEEAYLYDLNSENILYQFTDNNIMPADLYQRFKTAEGKLHEFVEKLKVSEE